MTPGLKKLMALAAPPLKKCQVQQAIRNCSYPQHPGHLLISAHLNQL
jgi:hypothetical protein